MTVKPLNHQSKPSSTADLGGFERSDKKKMKLPKYKRYICRNITNLHGVHAISVCILFPFMVLECKGAITVTISPNAEGLTKVMVTWDSPVPFWRTLTVMPADPLTGFSSGNGIAMDIYSQREGNPDVGDFVNLQYDAAFFFPGSFGVSSNPIGFGVYIDDDTGLGSRTDDDFHIVVASGGLMPSSGQFMLTMPGPSVGFENVFNQGQYSNNQTTVNVIVPEPSIPHVLALGIMSILWYRFPKNLVRL